jgi:L-ribulose-5-phosphate 4-epimerase
MPSDKELRESACRLNQLLPKQGLVTMHSGNVSVLDPERNRLFIKPSGMDYDQMRPEDMVEVDLQTGLARSGSLKPSVDLVHHLYLYRHIPGISSVIHTHSNYATAFAAVLKPIPLVLTAIADEFGGEVPCTPYVSNEGDLIGQTIVKYRTQAPAILLGNHGVFAWGATGDAALKAAVMVEDVARTVWLAMQLGMPQALPPEEAAKWNQRYTNAYGQAHSSSNINKTPS